MMLPETPTSTGCARPVAELDEHAGHRVGAALEDAHPIAAERFIAANPP